MTETIDEFYNRIYVNCIGYYPIVLVWLSAKAKGLITSDKKLRPKRWTIDQAKQYVQYLEAEAIEI